MVIKGTTMDITISVCTTEDLFILRAISYRTYKNTFEHLNSEANMKAYLTQAFNTDKLYRELTNNDSLFYFIYADGQMAGYMKINEFGAQTDIQDANALEIERIYITAEFQRAGLGRILLIKAMEIAIEKNKSYIWLGVWEKNEKALSFYRKSGFYKIGEHSFAMGDDKQTDYVMRKDLIGLDKVQKE
jgi:diamine N-acetyltransferase